MYIHKIHKDTKRGFEDVAWKENFDVLTSSQGVGRYLFDYSDHFTVFISKHI